MTDKEFDADVRAAAEAMYGSRSGKSAFMRVVAETMRLRGRSALAVRQACDEGLLHADTSGTQVQVGSSTSHPLRFTTGGVNAWEITTGAALSAVAAGAVVRAGDGAVGGPALSFGSETFEHAFYQDREPRESGKCDYTYPDGDWCGRPQTEHVSVADLNAALESACAQLRDANDGMNELERELASLKAAAESTLVAGLARPLPPARVTVGQVWEPCDKRYGPKTRERRRFKIIAIEGGVQVVVENLLLGRPDRQGRRRTIRRRILIARMRPGASGYRLIS